MNLHVSYQFQTPDGLKRGFGDCCIMDGPAPRDPEELKSLKQRLIAELAKDGIEGATVVILCWQPM